MPRITRSAQHLRQLGDIRRDPWRLRPWYCLGYGFNRRKMEDQRRDAAEKQATSRRAIDEQVLEDAERLIAAWNER